MLFRKSKNQLPRKPHILLTSVSAAATVSSSLRPICPPYVVTLDSVCSFFRCAVFPITSIELLRGRERAVQSSHMLDALLPVSIRRIDRRFRHRFTPRPPPPATSNSVIPTSTAGLCPCRCASKPCLTRMLPTHTTTVPHELQRLIRVTVVLHGNTPRRRHPLNPPSCNDRRCITPAPPPPSPRRFAAYGCSHHCCPCLCASGIPSIPPPL